MQRENIHGLRRRKPMLDFEQLVSTGGDAANNATISPLFYGAQTLLEVD